MNGNGKSVRNGAYRRGNGGPNGNGNGAPEERAGYARDFDPAAETGGYSSADYGVADRSYAWHPEARSSGNVQHGPSDYGRMYGCLLYTSPSPRDATLSRMPSSA